MLYREAITSLINLLRALPSKATGPIVGPGSFTWGSEAGFVCSKHRGEWSEPDNRPQRQRPPAGTTDGPLAPDYRRGSATFLRRLPEAPSRVRGAVLTLVGFSTVLIFVCGPGCTCSQSTWQTGGQLFSLPGCSAAGHTAIRTAAHLPLLSRSLSSSMNQKS